MNKKFLIVAAFLFLSCDKMQNTHRDITLVAVGDIMLGRYIGRVTHDYGSDFPFSKVASLLRAADIVFGNLESIISTSECRPSYPGKPYNFHASKDAAPALRNAGFTVLNLANNHAMDYGESSLTKTARLLAENGIVTLGAGKDGEQAHKPAIVSVSGTSFGFLGYSMAHAGSVYAGQQHAGIAQLKLDDIKRDIAELRGKVDVLVVSLHWGKEYDTMPTQQQRQDVHTMIDWGADIIIGHHPHVLQGLEIYNGKLIAYSLGNFVFDQQGRGTDKSILLACTFRGKQVNSIDVVPLDRFRHYFPKVAQEGEKQSILTNLRKISLPLNRDGNALAGLGLN